MATSQVSLLFVLLLLVVLGLSATETTGLTQERSASFCQNVVTPAYFYPSGSGASLWNEVIAAAPRNSITIANVDSGPGLGYDSNYLVINASVAAGIRVIGYVHTSYATISIDQVISNVTRWNQYYGVQSFFLDESDNTAGNVGYYTNLTQAIHKLFPQSFIIANMGTMPEAEGYMSLFDAICVYEDTYANYNSASWSVPSWYYNYPSTKYYHIAYSTPSSSLTTALQLSQQRNAGYVYFTDAAYSSLPSYFNTEIADLNQQCSSGTTSSTTVSSGGGGDGSGSGSTLTPPIRLFYLFFEFFKLSQ